MKFSASLISVAAVLCYGSLASLGEASTDPYYQDAGAQDYLSQYGAYVPQATEYSGYTVVPATTTEVPAKAAEKKEHKDGERCPITGKVLSNLYDGTVEHKDGKRCPITGKILTNLYGEDEIAKCAPHETDKEGKCPVTNKPLNSEHEVPVHQPVHPSHPSSHNFARGNVKSPRALKKVAEKKL